MGLWSLFTTSTPVRTVGGRKNTTRQRSVDVPLSARTAIRGYRSDTGDIEFKSAMEANLFRFYTSKGVKCEYEPDRFVFPKNSNSFNIHVYIPDFRINIGKFVYYLEAKGTMDKRSIEKIRLFQRFYPRLKLYLISWGTYKKIEKLYRHSIPTWE